MKYKGWIVVTFLGPVIAGCGSSPETSSPISNVPTVTAGDEVDREAQSKETFLGNPTESGSEESHPLTGIVNSRLSEQTFGEAVFE